MNNWILLYDIFLSFFHLSEIRMQKRQKKSFPSQLVDIKIAKSESMFKMSLNENSIFCWSQIYSSALTLARAGLDDFEIFFITST